MQNSSMTDIIYDYFYSRILFGYFLPGDQLPSISYICRQFQVSALIVRTAFARLREEGMLETIERKGSTVTYRPGKEQGRLYRESFLSRREGMEDICRHSDIIFGSIAQVYMQKQTEDSIHQIRTQLKKRKGHPAKQITMFYAEAMQPLNNPLAINLHWEIVRYLRIPYFEAANFGDTGIQAEDHIERMLTLIEAGNAEKAVEVMQAFNRDGPRLFIKGLPFMMNGEPPVEQIPFKWQIYREHPQLCYTLAAELMSKIDAQAYKQGEFLPSCQALAQEYGVSLITMRRTLELLNNICVTETLNGVGTRVLSGKPAGMPKLFQPIQKILVLYLQALQIGALSCHDVAIHTLSSLDDDGYDTLDRIIGRHIEERRAFLLAETCLRFIGGHSPSAFVKEVYHQLYHLLLWGHALHFFSQKMDASQTHEAYAHKLRDALSRRDAESFASQYAELMGLFLKGTKLLLLQLGFEEQQLV
ncbi:GntR family transcriptional regulator [Enterocloster bolteae]|uniref:GntR family transcriptional regulator n=1 Tax=Enterocloster bolteae TaxID=208479 RepID=UPI0028DB185A|nr:GntR family transcriptional regulator [Enterocloster bolteae]